MKILQVCAYTAQYSGNFIASLMALEMDLKKKGIETIYLFPDRVKDMPWCMKIKKSAEVYFAGMNRFSLETYKQVKMAMQEADIIHSHFELYDCITAIALKKGQKLFWHLHDSFDTNIDFPHQIINKIQYHFLGRKVTLISPSAYYAEYVINLGFSSKRVRVINNCIDIDRLKIDGQVKKKFDFLAFGGFYYTKGLDILLNSCRILKNKQIYCRLGIVGYETTWNWIEINYPDLKEYIEKLQPEEDVSSFYNLASVFVCPSRRESFSYALLEALYMEKPAIISEIPGTSWADLYSTVKTFKSEDVEKMAELMEQYMKNQHWYTQDVLKQVSVDIAKEYGISKWINELERVYFDV